MLADDVKARDELRLRRRVVIEDVELLDLNLFLRFRRSAAYIDVAVVHLHAVGEAPRVEPIPKKLWVARVGHVIKRYAGKERRAGRGLARIGRNWPRAGEIIWLLAAMIERQNFAGTAGAQIGALRARMTGNERQRFHVGGVANIHDQHAEDNSSIAREI